jgi:Skp family chaperone for outer membrane proteins
MKTLSYVFLMALTLSTHAANILISDTRDAFDRVQAMKTLLQDVDTRIQSIQQAYEKNLAPLSEELARLRQTAGQNQQRKAQLLLKIAELQKKAGAEQQAVGKANEKALAQIDATVSTIEAELKKERGADAVLRAQDTLYFNPACRCNITEEIYQRLNARLPKVALVLANAAANAGK